MKPFNLEEAKKKGVKSLVYRNGERPLEVFFSEHRREYPVITIAQSGKFKNITNEGFYYDEIDKSEWDLFMVEEEEMWVNVYLGKSVKTCSNIYSSKEEALEDGKRVAIENETYKLIKE